MTNFKSDEIYELEKHYRISLINSLIGYRALNLLGTSSTDGITNLCIISSVFHLGANPPLIGLVLRPEREHNDTLINITSTGEYTLNNVLPDWYMQAHQTSASYPSGVSEFDACGFKKQYIKGFKAPFVGQSNIRIGLELREVIDMEINGTTIVIGEVVHILTEDALIKADGTIDHINAGTMTVAGLDTYYLPQLVGQLGYAKPGVKPYLLSEDSDLIIKA
ncbi:MULTISPECIES: flavin reductase [unclassified Mucilaginibacter]|uniref:flavin reductase family protein n=1 Tax=unclassified Mucilaginibacter TaxID=2617802 RepID=UPI002AC8BFA0|nr:MULTISPECIES: flavin reductase [unclassified Mucilaginibacter]MEB0260104.1 flavin reductase [Mucilaginibacter sp. 10I4]MEB0279174.1 flavin reductase [Mucilaginibacter sp. 10B2]MEB0301569.1 flavin reductase [Mucilaginibacter sp. 5C4]WPX22353.1 flavin reductase [Mucilaginibacter sp. 5C4]